MTRLIVSFYDNFEAANQAVAELIDKGFCHDEISLIALQVACKRTWGIELSKPRFYSSQSSEIKLPGIGRVLVSGFLVSDIVFMEPRPRSLVCVLESRMIPGIDAQVYSEGVRRGGILVLVNAERTNSNKALTILDRYCPVDIQALEDQWREIGWTGFDDTARPIQRDGMNWPNCITSLPGDGLLFDGVLKNWPQNIAGRKIAQK